ncbi:hypothetical protein [Serratia fonticola]|uniref:hypothetical protein n=1 Tax=Serratia fonticola TaxID=47917 RepID=UPI003AB0EF3B
MLTFKHFCDRPSWAASAGYEFNLFDCMSYAACATPIFDGLKCLASNTLDIEIRTILWDLPLSILVALALITYPLTFWLYGLVVYIKCIRHRRKYLNSTDPMVIKNLKVWQRDLEWRWQRGEATKTTL